MSSSSDDFPTPKPTNTSAPYDPASFNHLLNRLKSTLKQDGIHPRAKRYTNTFSSVLLVATVFNSATSIAKSIEAKEKRKALAKLNKEMESKLKRSQAEIKEMKGKLTGMKCELEKAKREVETNKALIERNNAALRGNKILIDRNNDDLLKNAAALTAFDHTLESQYSISTAELASISKQLDQVLVELDATRIEINSSIKSVQDAVVEAIYKGRVEPIISHLKSFFAYFISESKRINRMAVRVRVAKLEDSHDLMAILTRSRLPLTGTLFSLLSDIVNQEFAIPKHAHDQMAPAMLNMLIYGTQVFAMIEVFMLEQYQFLARVYWRQIDLESYNKYMSKVMHTWHSFSASLLEKGGLFERVVGVLKRVGELPWVREGDGGLQELAIETIDNLQKIKVALVQIGDFLKANEKPVFSPELIFHDHHNVGFEKIRKADTKSSGWATAKKVSYSMQFFDAKSNCGSMVTDWIDTDLAYEQYANPLITGVPVDVHGRNRLVYRRFDSGPAMLVANLSDPLVTSFRDVDRDFFNAVLEPNEEIGLAELEVYCGKANVNASFENNKRVLHVALENANYNVLKQLVNAGVGFDVQDIDGHSPIFIAAQANAVDTVKMMIENGANVNIKTGPGALEVTPLHSAIVQNYTELADLLINSPHVDLNAQATNGLPPLHYAASLDRVDIVKQLIEIGNRTAINARSKQNYTALHMAAISNSARVARLLLETKRMDINAQAVDGVTPLHLAGLYGANDTVVELLHFGANMAARTENGSVPLHYAADHGNLQVVSMLAERSREFINTLNDREMSPLYNAMQSNKTQAAEVLLKNCAMLELRLNHNKTLLHVAAMNGHTVAAINLIKAGLSVHSVDDRSNTPLHYAVVNGNAETAKALLANGADANARDKRGQTPLHLTAFLDEQPALKMAQLLASNQADVDAQTAPSKFTLLHLAAQFGRYLIAKFLIGTGADVSAVDSQNQTALHHAAQAGSLSIVKLLLNTSVAVDHKNKKGETALHLASAEGDLEAAKVLVDVGKASISATGVDNRTPLAYAVNGKGTYLMYKWFVEDKHINATAFRDTKHLSLLHLAAKTNKTDIIADLIEKRKIWNYVYFKSYNAPIPETGNYLAHYACLYANAKLYEFLLNEYHHDQLNLPNKKGEWPLATYIRGNGSLQTFERYFFNNTYFVKNTEVKWDKSYIHVTFERITPKDLVPYAAFHNRSEFVPFLIGKKLDFKKETYKGLKAIHHAARNGNLPMVKVLVEKGADANDLDGEQKTALFHAVEGHGDLALVKYLINIPNAKFETIRDKRGFTVADAAIRANKTEIARYLHLEKSVNFKDFDAEGQTPLHVTAYWNNLQGVKYLLEKKGLKVDQKDAKGQTALYKAIDGFGQMELVRFLVERYNASLATLDVKTCNTYVYQALLRNKTDIAKWLIEKKKGIDIDSIGPSGEAPLHLAVKQDNVDMVRLLLASNAVSLAKDSHGMTPARVAYRDQKDAVLRFILFEYRKNDGQTPLHEAAGKADLEMVRFLLQRGVSLNAKDRANRTAAHVAAENKDAEAVVKLLVEQKCLDLAAKNVDNLTPLEVARYNNFDRLADILEKGGKQRVVSRKARSVPFGTSGSLNSASSLVDVNGTMLLADLIARKVTGKRWSCTNTTDSVISQNDVRSFALKLSNAFEAMLKAISTKFGLNVSGFDSFKLYQNLESAACSGKWVEMEKTLTEVGLGALGVEKGSKVGRYLAVEIDRLLIEVPVKGGRGRVN